MKSLCIMTDAMMTQLSLRYDLNLGNQSRVKPLLMSTKGQTLAKSLLSLALLTVLTACSSSPAAVKNADNLAIPLPDSSKRTYDPHEAAKIRTAIAGQYIRERKLDNAQRELQRALESDSRYAPAYDMMGVLLQQEGSLSNLQKAQGFFKKAISLDPEFTQAHNNYGVYLSQMKQYNAAMQEFEIAGSTLGYEGRGRALENLGSVALKLNQPEKALQAFTKALDVNDQSLIARMEMVDYYLKKGNYTLAQKYYSELVALIGDNPLGARVTLQGIKLAKIYGYTQDQQRLTQKLFDDYPASDEAKQMKVWLANPTAVWQ